MGNDAYRDIRAIGHVAGWTDSKLLEGLVGAIDALGVFESAREVLICGIIDEYRATLSRRLA